MLNRRKGNANSPNERNTSTKLREVAMSLQTSIRVQEKKKKKDISSRDNNQIFPGKREKVFSTRSKEESQTSRFRKKKKRVSYRGGEENKRKKHVRRGGGRGGQYVLRSGENVSWPIWGEKKFGSTVKASVRRGKKKVEPQIALNSGGGP